MLDIFPDAPQAQHRCLALLVTMRDDDPLPTLQRLAGQGMIGVDMMERFAAAWNLAATDAEALWQQT